MNIRCLSFYITDSTKDANPSGQAPGFQFVFCIYTFDFVLFSDCRDIKWPLLSWILCIHVTYHLGRDLLYNLFQYSFILLDCCRIFNVDISNSKSLYTFNLCQVFFHKIPTVSSFPFTIVYILKICKKSLKIPRRKSKKNRHHNGQKKKNRHNNGQKKKNRHHNGQKKKNRHHNGQKKKNRHHNGQKKRYKMKNNDIQNIHIKLKID